MNKPGHGESGSAERDTCDQHRARADAVDQKASGSLEYRRNQVKGGQRQSQIGVADAKVVADKREQRRQNDHVIVTEEMRRANRRDDTHFAKAPRGNGDGLRHFLTFSAPEPLALCSACQMRNGVSGMST